MVKVLRWDQRLDLDAKASLPGSFTILRHPDYTLVLKFLRKIRQRLLAENRFSKYLLYAIGEIVLVVIGILIALQINTWKEERVLRNTELKFLNGIRSDLMLNIEAIDEKVALIKNALKSAEVVMAYFEGAPIQELDSFNLHTIEVLRIHPFHRNNSTFEELVSSGNLGILPTIP